MPTVLIPISEAFPGSPLRQPEVASQPFPRLPSSPGDGHFIGRAFYSLVKPAKAQKTESQAERERGGGESRQRQRQRQRSETASRSRDRETRIETETQNTGGEGEKGREEAELGSPSLLPPLQFLRVDFMSLSPPGHSQSALVPELLRLLRQDGPVRRMQAPCELGAI